MKSNRKRLITYANAHINSNYFVTTVTKNDSTPSSSPTESANFSLNYFTSVYLPNFLRIFHLPQHAHYMRWLQSSFVPWPLSCQSSTPTHRQAQMNYTRPAISQSHPKSFNLSSLIYIISYGWKPAVETQIYKKWLRSNTTYYRREVPIQWPVW